MVIVGKNAAKEIRLITVNIDYSVGDKVMLR
jgi:hypothetical protein